VETEQCNTRTDQEYNPDLGASAWPNNG